MNELIFLFAAIVFFLVALGGLISILFALREMYRTRKNLRDLKGLRREDETSL